MKNFIALAVITLAFTGTAFAKTGKQESAPCAQITAGLKQKLDANKPAGKADGSSDDKKPADNSGAQ